MKPLTQLFVLLSEISAVIALSHHPVTNPCSRMDFSGQTTLSHNRLYTKSYHNGIIRSATTLHATSIFPLISSTDTWGNIATLSSVAALSQWLGKTTKIGKLLGPPVTAMALAFGLGSVGILSPGGSPGAKAIQLFSLQLATPMILLGVNLQDCTKNGGPVLIAFLLASFATWVASITAMHIPQISHSMVQALGDDAWKIAAALLAKNIGGGINYIAVCQTLQASSNAIAAGLCVDNIFALIYFPLSSALSAGRLDVQKNVDLNRVDGDIRRDTATMSVQSNYTTENHRHMNLETISATIAFASTITWLGERLGGSSGALPISTLLTILFTTLGPEPTSQLRSTGETLGTSLLYLFFATAGAPGITIADSVKSSFLPISAFLFVLYSIHALILVLCRFLAKRWWIFQRIVRKDLEGEEENWDAESPFLPQRLLVASSAAIGGPATAVALAQANGWTSLIGPSVLVGNLGYAIATFCGLIFYTVLLKSM